MVRKLKFSFFLIIVAFVLFTPVGGGYAYASSGLFQNLGELLFIGGKDEDSSTKEKEDTASEEIKDLEKKIADIEKKLKEVQNTELSLSRELDQLNGQISLTESKIAYSNAQIARKEQEITRISVDIENLTNRIFKLEESIDYQAQLLNSRTRERYKNIDSSPVVFLFGADTVSKLLQKTQYLKVVEVQDSKILTQMNSTKQNYHVQQDLFEQKKDREVVLMKQIEKEKENLANYKSILDSKQNEKKHLLAVTQNDEQKFQKMLDEAQRELNQIVGAVSVLKNQQSKSVKKGEIIGIQGNTGYSFGDHLHFGVYRYSSFDDIDGWNWYYNNYVDPLKKLKKKTVYWNTGCEGASNRSVGSGDWDWPMSNPTVSQGFGYTCWSPVYYGGKVHPALDMYGAYGAPVYAVEDGDAFFCRNCMGDGGNGVFIFHKDKYMTVYWHLR